MLLLNGWYVTLFYLILFLLLLKSQLSNRIDSIQHLTRLWCYISYLLLALNRTLLAFQLRQFSPILSQFRWVRLKKMLLVDSVGRGIHCVSWFCLVLSIRVPTWTFQILRSCLSCCLERLAVFGFSITNLKHIPGLWCRYQIISTL